MLRILDDLKLIVRKLNEDNFQKNIFKIESELPLGLDLFIYLYENQDYIYMLSLDDKKQIVSRISKYSLRECLKTIMKTNQYVDLNTSLIKDIENLYKDVFSKTIFHNHSYEDLKTIHNKHQLDLINIFFNIEELKVLNKGLDTIEIIPCAEYAGEQQLNMMNISLEDLKEPILDLGCGMEANLVEFLREKNLEAYGIDRFIDIEKDYLEEISWLNYKFHKNKWGSIISHLAFTNNFKREHLKKKGLYIDYANKYLEILNSLKIGGSFYYTPRIDFIEDLLPKDKFQVNKEEVSVFFYDIGSTKIKKLKE